MEYNIQNLLFVKKNVPCGFGCTYAHQTVTL